MNRNQPTRPEMTLRDVCRAVFRHRKKAMAFFLLVMTATVLVTLLTPKAYLSQSKLFVRLGRENAMLDPAATFGDAPVAVVPMSRESEINSVSEMLSSRVILENVVDQVGPETILNGLPPVTSEKEAKDVGLARWMDHAGQQVQDWASGAIDSLRNQLSTSDLSDRELAIERLGKRLGVEPVRDTNVVLATYEAPQPELAQLVVETLVDAYLDQHIRLNRTQGSYDFFAEHTERLDDELKGLEETLRELKTTTGLTSVDQQREQIVARMGGLEDDLQSMEAAQSETEAKVISLQQKLSELPREQVTETSTGIGNTGTDMIRESFFALQIREKEASAIYTPDHPKLKTIREELAEAERILAQQEPTRTHVTMAPDASYKQTRLALLAEEPQLAAIKAKTKSLQSQLAEVRGSLEILNGNETRIVQLKREIGLREANYRTYATNLEQARIDRAMETQRMSNLSIVQPASLEPRPIRPRKALNLALGLIVAVCGAFSIALIAEYIDHSMRTPEDIERNLDLPTLTSIPRMRRDALKANGRT